MIPGSGRGRLVAITAAVGAVVFLLGAVAGRVSARPSGVDDESGASAPFGASEGGRHADDATGSEVDASGSRSGGDRSEGGARAVALAFASADQRWLYLDDRSIAYEVAAVATPEAAPRLTADVRAAVGLLRDALAASPGPVWWVVRPLAARVESYTSERARVAVWVVGVLSAVEVAVPQSHWVTVTVELAWTEGEWRVDGMEERPGPTPVLDASDDPWRPEQLAEALAGFEPLAGQP